MRQTVVKALKSLDAISVENVCGAGTPDVNYTRGWIELKFLAAWPKNPSAIVAIKLRPEQRAWHVRRWRAGGKVFVFTKIGRDWMLHDAYVAAHLLGSSWTRADCVQNSLAYWNGTPDWDQLKRIIT